MSAGKISQEELAELRRKLLEDPEFVHNIPDEQIAEIRRQMDPLGAVISTKKQYANLAIVNWRDLWFRRLHMTALVGYLYRVLEEYEPEEEIARATETFKQRSAQLKPESPEYKQLEEEHQARVKLMKDTAKAIIKKFLNRNFNYNPDAHLRGSHTSNPADPERKPKDEAIREACKTAEKAPGVEAKLQSKPETLYKYMRDHMLHTYQAALDAKNAIAGAVTNLARGDLDAEEKQAFLMKKHHLLDYIVDNMKPVVEPLNAADTLSAWKVDPPADVFHHFDRYITNHYEQLREVVKALYNEKPDLEFAVIFYDVFPTAEAAREYRIQHESEFRTEVVTIESGAVCLLGPFKENRERIDFYNKNAEILKIMMDQVESDHKLGKDLMEKAVKIQKRKNIEEAGPDAPGLSTYISAQNTIRELGAKKILTREEQLALEEAKKQAQQIKEDYEVPDDAIQMDVFYPETNKDGTTELKRKKFYTQAEAPVHLQEGADEKLVQYQPKRDATERLDTAYRVETIVDKDGKEKQVRVPASHQKK